MKRTFYIILIIPFYLYSCSENDTVSENEKKFPIDRCPVNNCYIEGLEIFFADTCSYKFITEFISSFDSVVVRNYSLGSDFYLYADSGDYNYWNKYFENDSTIDDIQNIIAPRDSMILVIRTTGEKAMEEEKQRFSKIKHLEIIKIHLHPKSVFVQVSENTESKWEAIFRRYIFVSEVRIVAVCEES